MLPANIKLEEIDPGIRSLIIDLNRIPGMIIDANCEGEERYCPPVVPVKEGYVWISRPRESHESLITQMQQVCSRYNFASIEELKDQLRENMVTYFLGADFESYEDAEGKNLFDEIWNVRQRRNFFRRAETRKKHMLKLWQDLDVAVRDYIARNVNPNVESLPYRGTHMVFGRMCGN